jgi:hypothetical protein
MLYRPTSWLLHSCRQRFRPKHNAGDACCLWARNDVAVACMQHDSRYQHLASCIGSTAFLSSSSGNESAEQILSRFATLDYRRAERTGFPEAVFAQGKTPKQVAIILDEFARHANEAIHAEQHEYAVNANNNGNGDRMSCLKKVILATRYVP